MSVEPFTSWRSSPPHDAALVDEAQSVEVGDGAQFARVAAQDGVDAEQGDGLDRVAGLLVELADHGVVRVLAVVHAASRQRPASGAVAGHPAGEQHLPVPYADCVGRDPQFPVHTVTLCGPRRVGVVNVRVGDAAGGASRGARAPCPAVRVSPYAALCPR